MILAVIGSEELYNQVSKLNFRGDLDIRHIEPSTPAALCRKLEGDQEYTDVLLELASVKGTNADETVAVVDRLLRTTRIHIMVLLEGYMPDSRLVRDLQSLGVEERDIYLQAGISLKIAISRLLRTEQAAAQDSEISPAPAAVEVMPPSQVNAAAGKAMQIKKPVRPASRAVTIAAACAAHYGYQYDAHDSLEDAGATLFCARKCAEDELQPKAGYYLENGNILFVQKCDTGCDYTLYDSDNNIVDGGRLDNIEMTVLDTRNKIVLEYFSVGDIVAMSRERLEEFLQQEEAAEQPKAQQKEEMQVLIVRPGKYPEKAVIDGSLNSMQSIVGGSIELVYPWEERIVLVCNEEGLLLNLPVNRFLYEIDEPIMGTFFICGQGDENLIGLNDEQIKRFGQRFHYPQIVEISDIAILVTDYIPEHLPPLEDPLSP